MNKEEKTKEAYAEILKVLKKHKDVCAYDIKEMESTANNHLFGVELKEKYGIAIDPLDVRSLEYINLGDYKAIGWWGEKYRRTVSWEDNGKQVKDELLFVINFSTGAYVFGDDYPTELFKELWQELKSYEPKYCDTANHGLYFAIDNASKIFNDFDSILEKYYEKNKKDYKKRQIKKMKEELSKLEESDE